MVYIALVAVPVSKMKTPSNPTRQPIRIVEMSAFAERVDSVLSAQERRALFLLLADDPTCGAPVARLPGLLRLEYAKQVIVYSLAPNFLTVYLLSIEPKDGGSPPPSKEEVSALRKTLSILGKAALIAVVKRGVKWLWEMIKDNMPPFG